MRRGDRGERARAPRSRRRAGARGREGRGLRARRARLGARGRNDALGEQGRVALGNARLTAGRLRVEVPRGVKVELTSVTRLGYISATDDAGQAFYEAGGSSGTEPTRTTLGSGDKTIRLKTDVGIGDVFVHVRSQAPSKTPGSSS